MSNDQQKAASESQAQQAHEKLVSIIVNGQAKEVRKERITFEALIGLAYNNNPPSSNDFAFTITFRRGDAGHEQGELDPGESVMVVKGMIFNVTATKKS